MEKAIDPPQKVTALTEADQKRLRDQRAVVKRCLGNEESKRKYNAKSGAAQGTSLTWL